MANAYYIGIDVGTGSARAALVKHDGTLVASSTQETKTWRDTKDHRIFEQSTTDIWDGIRATVKAVLAEANVSPSDVRGLGFDATCSLAVADFDGNPVTVTKGEQLGQIGERNIILWADHRAEEEALLINGTGNVVLDYVGGVMSVSSSSDVLCGGKQHRSMFANAHCSAPLTAGDGDSENAVAQTPHETRFVLPLPVLRSPRLPHVPRHGKQPAIDLFADVQVLVRAQLRLAAPVLREDRPGRVCKK